MSERTLSRRQFNHDPSGAKRAADTGPVLITHRGEVSHVLLTIEDYRRPSGERRTLVELIGMPPDDDIEFEPARLDISPRPVDLSD